MFVYSLLLVVVVVVIVVVSLPGDVVGRQDFGASPQHRRRLQPPGHADPR